MGNQFVSISAGSGYGYRTAWYEVVSDRLVLRDEGDHDNLSGNSLVDDFEGLSLEEARAKAKAFNSEGSGHNYDGCHACQWSIEVAVSEPPEHLTYSEPKELAIIRAALAVYRKEPGAFSQLKAAIRSS